MSYDQPAQPPDNPDPSRYPADLGRYDDSAKKRLAAAGRRGGSYWQRLRSHAVEDGTATQAHGYNSDQIEYFDYNFHSAKKLVSSTLLDVALLMANVSQLKAIYLAGRSHPFYVAVMTLLVISIILQVVSGLLLIWLGRININEPEATKHRQATALSNTILVLIFVLTLINIIVSSLGISNEVAYSNFTSLGDM